MPRPPSPVVRAVNVDELLAVLCALPSVHKVGFQPPVNAAVLLAGIEIAHAPASDEQAFRKMWRERHGGGATPLVLVADDPGEPGYALVLGPLDGGPLRSVGVAPLQLALARIVTLPRLQAIRELAAEVQLALDQQPALPAGENGVE